MATIAPQLSLDPKTTKALLIGVSDYAPLSRIAPAISNLDGLQQALEDPAILGLPSEHIIRVENRRHDEIFDAIADFVEDKNNLDTHTLILYYCGHGLRKSRKDKELFLSGINTKRDRLTTTGIRFAEIKQKLENSHLQSRLLILDACYSGLAAMDEAASTLTKQEATIKETYVLASAGEDEKAYFDTDARHTFFTEALLQVIQKGIADRNPFLELEDLYHELKATYEHATPRRIDNLDTRPFFLFRNQGLNAEHIWQETQQTNTAKAFAEYLNLFPGGPFLEEALWGHAVLLQQAEAYQRYLTHFPDGVHALLAKEEQSWLQAKAANTIDAWLHFVRGFHQIEEDRTERRVEEAFDRISKLGRNTRLDKNQRNQLKAKIGALRQEIAQLKQEKMALQQAEQQIEKSQLAENEWEEERQALLGQIITLKKQVTPAPSIKPKVDRTFDFPLPEMIPIPGGTFQMGSNEDDREKPMHEVTVASFEFGKYPVTQRQWQAIMGSNPSHFQGENLPVERVSWDDIQDYLQKLNQKTGLNFRLPTEAEWEYAAGGGMENRTKYASTNEEAQLGEYAWYRKNSDTQTHPVGTKQPNALGLYDLSGNVWEWCQDVWHANYQGTPTDGSAWEAEDGLFRVLRGGSWYSGAGRCRVANRGRGGPANRGHGLGFRLAR
ncbi:MAG: SUMF1/EgtB/PvdO family nonheme iron enzyme [Bacteroidota bacterium]